MEKNHAQKKKTNGQPKGADRLGNLARRQKRCADCQREQHTPKPNPQMKKQALEDFVHLFEDEHKEERAKEVVHEKQVEELYAEIGRLSAQLSWLKKKIWL